MAKKEANSFVLTIAGIAAATVIGVVGVKLTPAPHVIFSLAPSAEPQATAEPEPISCVLAGTGQVVDFADPGAEEYVSLLDTDSQSLTERYAPARFGADDPVRHRKPDCPFAGHPAHSDPRY